MGVMEWSEGGGQPNPKASKELNIQGYEATVVYPKESNNAIMKSLVEQCKVYGSLGDLL